MIGEAPTLLAPGALRSFLFTGAICIAKPGQDIRTDLDNELEGVSCLSNPSHKLLIQPQRRTLLHARGDSLRSGGRGERSH